MERVNGALLLKNLIKGEKVKCITCGNGYYEPYNNTNHETTHCFVCSNCKEKINID